MRGTKARREVFGDVGKGVRNMKKQMRDSNIELLRVVAMLGVIVLHFNGEYGNAFELVKDGTINFYILQFLESLFIPAVNVFILVSGYFLCDSYKRPITKALYLMIQVMLFREGLYLLGCIVGNSQISISAAICALLPINYYVILYVVLYLISPYINLSLRKMGEKQRNILMIVSILLFSVWPTLVDIMEEVIGQELAGLNTIGLEGDQSGYTIVNFILLYLIGAYLKMADIQWSKLKSIFVIIGCAILLSLWELVLPKTAWMYCNPLVILEAVAGFLLFKKFSIKSSVVNVLAKGVFTCFLLHGAFFRFLPVEKFVNAPAWKLVLFLVGVAIGIYIVCVGVHYLYVVFEKYVLKNLLKFLNKVVLDVEPNEEGKLCK